jgi:hypothetical protein
MFRCVLHLTNSSHTPLDYGGPYRQLRGHLAEEIMKPASLCHPFTDFHRNPLFRHVVQSAFIAVVPDAGCVSAQAMRLYAFLGKLMGNAMVTATPIPLGMSPFVWKFLVDHPLDFEDYSKGVDHSARSVLDNVEYLRDDPEYIVGLEAALAETESTTLDNATTAQLQRAAQYALLHSMDRQLAAMKEGLQEVVPLQALRCLAWRDLESMVCGNPIPSFEDFKQKVIVFDGIPPDVEEMFWAVFKDFTEDERADFLLFTMGQRRMPNGLPPRIVVKRCKLTPDHLPMAGTCGRYMDLPLYRSKAVMREKLLKAFTAHEMEMA